MVVCRLLPYAVADGVHNMAADETMLQSAAAGQVSLRFYGWSPATLSLGYFQSARVRNNDPALAQLPYVRRPSGGMTLVHHYELTYALALPAGAPWQTRQAKPWLCRMHDIIADALRGLGVECAVASCDTGCQAAGLGGDSDQSTSLCFQHVTAGDLLIGGAKIVGSAQRRQRGALLQHGGILLAASPHTPALSGIADLSQRRLDIDAVRHTIARAWTEHTGWPLEQATWSSDETAQIEKLAQTKYSQTSWNDRR